MKFPGIRLTLQWKLILSFAALLGLFLALAYSSLLASRAGELAIRELESVNATLRLAKDIGINMADAGQLPHEIAQAGMQGLRESRERLAALQSGFERLGTQIREQGAGTSFQPLAEELVVKGQELYGGLADFLPVREKMLVYLTEFKGELQSLPSVLTDRELGHIKFIRSLKKSVKEHKRLTGGMDYRECSFYQWYTEHPIQDKDIAEVFEEIDPLHRQLHTYAAEIDKKMAVEDWEGAENVLARAEEDLNRLGLFFSGLRDLGADKYREQAEKFNAILHTVESLYVEANARAQKLEGFLKDTVQKESRDRMQRSKEAAARQMRLYLGSTLALILLVSISFTIIMHRTVKAIHHIAGELLDTAGRVDDVGSGVADIANQTLERAGSTADTMEETCESLTIVAESVKQMNIAIGTISEHTTVSAGIATDAAREVRGSADAVAELEKEVEAISSASTIIRNIAFKINLLALNANVEAARAGEAGAGFAVVASEVKNLAAATGEAAESIMEKLSAITGKSRDATVAMENIVVVINRVSESFSAVAASVEEQSAITGEIDCKVNEVLRLSGKTGEDVRELEGAADATHEKSGILNTEGKNLLQCAEELQELIVKL